MAQTFKFLDMVQPVAPRNTLYDAIRNFGQTVGDTMGAIRERNRLLELGDEIRKRGLQGGAEKAFELGDVDRGLNMQDKARTYSMQDRKIGIEDEERARGRKAAQELKGLLPSQYHGMLDNISGDDAMKLLNSYQGNQIQRGQLGIQQEAAQRQRELHPFQILQQEQAVKKGQPGALIEERMTALQAAGIDPKSPEGRRYLVMGDLGKAEKADAPAGYKWVVNPQTGAKELEAVAGGPATKVPGDIAGKVAMMRGSMREIQQLRNVYERAWTAGDLGRQAAANVPLIGDIAALSGNIGVAQRAIRTGVESALRTMTGAAAPESEVVRYMAMFMPTARDTVQSAKQKIDNLMNFMAEAEELVTQGRGGLREKQPQPQQPQGQPTRVTIPAKGIPDAAAPQKPRARNAQTGQEVEFDGEKWVPVR